MTLPHRISGKRVLAHLKDSRTEWADCKSWFSARKGVESFPPGEVAERAGIDVACFAMRSVPGADRAGRELAAAFAWGPDGRLAEAYKDATNGDRTLEEGISVLMGWLDGTVGDDAAARTRWNLSLARNAAKGGAADVLDALLCAFAPCAWGGAALAHVAALSANGSLLGKAHVADGVKVLAADAKKAALATANEYHVAMFADIVG